MWYRREVKELGKLAGEGIVWGSNTHTPPITQMPTCHTEPEVSPVTLKADAPEQSCEEDAPTPKPFCPVPCHHSHHLPAASAPPSLTAWRENGEDLT